MSEPRLCVLGEHLASWPCHCDEIKNYLATNPSLVDLDHPATETEVAKVLLSVFGHKMGHIAGVTLAGEAEIRAEDFLTAWRNLRREGGK